MMNNLNNFNKGIYVHIPFCVHKCVYCDFLSAPAEDDLKIKYTDALINEIIESSKECEGECFDTVFIGGGTPSCISSSLISSIIKTIKDNYALSPYCEITIECNPGTINEAKLLDYRDCNINRISLGVQSGIDEELSMLGRIHNTKDVESSFSLLRKCGFNNINIDLMSGIPGQNTEKFIKSLEFVLALAPEHISAYSLIVEDNTFLAENLDKFPQIPDEDTDREIYHRTQELLEKSGYRRYEISNYSKPGYECRHNLHYWNREEYIGFGIGAASFHQNKRYNNINDINSYINTFGDIGRIRENIEIMTINDAMEEFMFLGLRKTDGVDVSRFYELFGKQVVDVYGDVISKHIHNGLLKKEGNRLMLTPLGLDISNYVMSDFIID